MNKKNYLNHQKKKQLIGNRSISIMCYLEPKHINKLLLIPLHMERM